MRIAPDFLSASMPRSSRSLRDGDVLDDAVLDVLEPGVVGVEDLAAGLRVEPLLGADAPRHGQQPVEVAADRLRLGRALAHALEAGELPLCLLAHVVGHRRLGDLRAELLDDGRLVLAELLADRLDLLAQHVLALLLLHAGVDVLADPLADLHQREALALERERELEPLGDVDGLEHLHLLLEGQVGRVAGRVGERAGVGDRADEGCDAAVVAAQLEDLLDDGAVLGLELADALVGRAAVRALLDLDEEAARASVSAAPAIARWRPLERHGGAAARQPDAVGDLGDGADLGVLALVLGHEQHALLVADVDRQRHVHVGEDDDVVEWDEQELAHGRFTLLGSFSDVGHTSTNYKNCTGIPEGGAWRRGPNPYGTRTNPRSGRRVSVSGARLSRISPPGTGHRLRSRTPRARPRHGGRPHAGALCRSFAGRSSRGSGAARPRRPGPRARPTDPGAPERYVITVTTMPPCQRTMPVSWRAASIQPALWSTRTPASCPTTRSSLPGSRTCARR